MITLLNKNKLFLYCLVVIISSSFFASLIQTSFGKVDVKLMNLKTPDGQNLVYDLYKPSIATEDDKFNERLFCFIGIFSLLFTALCIFFGTPNKPA